LKNPIYKATFRFTMTRWVLLLVFFLLLSPAFHPLKAQHNKEREKLERSKKDIENEINYTTKLLNETKKSRQLSVNQVIILNNQIQKRERLITTISSEVDNLHVQITSNQSYVERLKADLVKLKADYARMIYHAYKNNNAFNRLMFIFAAKDFNQAYQRLKYFQQYSDYRKQQVSLILAIEGKINGKIRELVDQKNEKLVLLDSKEHEKSKLTREKEEKKQTLTQLQQKEKELRNRLKEKEKALKKLQVAIENLISEEIKKSADNAKKTGAKPAEAGTFTMTPEEKELSSNFSNNRGRLPWPAEKGIISSTFGEHEHPVLKGIKTQNNGINIITAAGSAARAVFSGTVSAVMNIPDLNNVIIIRHGEFLTVYCNLKTVSVKKGDKIKTKQSIGTIYTDPEDSKTELHFEIRDGKKLMDPAIWLAH
jgi:murein hydrolase activator